jgi:MATE family multidrug resistance protein
VFAKFKEYLPYYRRNLKVALPVMLTQLGASLGGLFDSMMVGHYGTVELAAVSFSNAIFFTVMVFAMGALMGITPLIGIHMGEMSEAMDKRDELRAKISSLLQNGVLFTILLIGLMVLLLGGCIPFFGQVWTGPCRNRSGKTLLYIDSYLISTILDFYFL